MGMAAQHQVHPVVNQVMGHSCLGIILGIFIFRSPVHGGDDQVAVLVLQVSEGIVDSIIILAAVIQQGEHADLYAADFFHQVPVVTEIGNLHTVQSPHGILVACLPKIVGVVVA